MCLFGKNSIFPHSCIEFISNTSTFTGKKTRSKLKLPDSFEAKLFLDSYDSKDILIGITDNELWEENCLNFIDNIWCLKPFTGKKYSTDKGSENYLDISAKEKDFILITKIKDELFFRINYEFSPIAFKLDKRIKDYFLYIENDMQISKTKIVFIYIRKI